ncbi:hypothetical protein [Tulasnella ambivirus 2]|uniref:Uncharacterized protein n=1 Tax=Tulasnella ambivirus 2 TaxID=2772290 RepID=A0A7S8BEX7_9VIRU|nr:hypothetical protein [Tulasnella ambivirus 2]
MSPSPFENDAIVLLGHTPKEDQTINEHIRNLGLKLLRARPSDVALMGTPDYHQLRYGLFKHFFHAFMLGSVDVLVTSTFQAQTAQLKWDMFMPKTFGVVIPPITPATICLSFPVEVSDEVWSSLRENQKAGKKLDGRVDEGTTTDGKRALYFTPKDWYSYDKTFQGNGCNLTAACPYNTVNPLAWSTLKNILVAVFAGIHAIRYPAWKDAAQVGEFGDKLITEAPKRQIASADKPDMLVDAEDYEIAEIELSGDHQSVKTNRLDNQAIDYTELPEGITFIDLDLPDQIPSDCHGLYFPYFAALADYDHKPVTDFLRNYCKLSFGSTKEASLRALGLILSDWKGISCNTDTGKELSHIATVLNLALEVQGRPLPLFRRGRYVGCILQGFAFTIKYKDTFIRPVGPQTIRQAVERTDLHHAALEDIAGKVVMTGRAADVMACKSMLELAVVLKKLGIAVTDVEEVKRLAGMLNFGEKHWVPSLPNLQKALRMCSAPNFTIQGQLKEEAIPIHPTRLFSTDQVDIVWSCFGPTAPSFRVPRAPRFELAKDMIFHAGGKGKGIDQRLVRIFVRQKELDIAVEDIKWVLREKCIENPVAAPTGKASQMNMDRSYSGANGTALMASLRLAAGINLTDSKKRSSDEASGSASKKARDETSIDTDL